MTQAAKLTEGALRTWLAGGRKKHDELRDTEVKGFSVRVNRDSLLGEVANASYRVSYRVDGKQRRPTIAPYGESSLPKARKAAADLKAQGRSGIDRLKEKRVAKEKAEEEKNRAESKLPTISKWFTSTHRDRLYERGASGQRRINYFERDWSKPLGHLTGEELSVKLVASVLKGRTHYQTDEPLGEPTLKKYIDNLKEVVAAYTRDNNCTNPLVNTKWKDYVQSADLKWSSTNDTEGDPRRAFTPLEFEAITGHLESLHSEGNHLNPLALLFMAYSGMRPSDIMELKWQHIKAENVDYPHIRKTLHKTRRSNSAPTTIPLSPKAVSILNRAQNLSGGDFVFSEHTKAKNTQGINYWWDKVEEHVGIKAAPYQLRHNLAHKILKEGTIVDVAATLGNSVEVCIRHYLNSNPRQAAEVLARVDPN